MSRSIPTQAGVFAAFHVALVIVAASWLLACLFVVVILEMSDFPTWVSPAVFGAGVVAVVLVAVRFGRRLLRTPAVGWLPWTIAYAAMPGVLAMGSLELVWSVCHEYEMQGPQSPAGLQSIVSVRDAGFGVSADFYSDVRILGRDGALVAEWRDPEGWGCRAGPRRLLDSMCWTGAEELEFESAAGKVQLKAR